MSGIPEPTVMPVDRPEWFRQLHLSNFVNAYYEYRDLESLPNARRVLIVGPGQGLDVQVLRWRGYDVTTLDIDDTFQPDQVGSVHDLSRFADGHFDVVIASHVLEHFALPYLDQALAEIARVARYAIVYLPLHGRPAQVRIKLPFGGHDIPITFSLFNPFKKADGMTPRFMGGQHFWEIGLRGFRVRDVERRVSAHFKVLSKYRNQDWMGSYNFVLESKRGSAGA
jgi:hypothetical protein